MPAIVGEGAFDGCRQMATVKPITTNAAKAGTATRQFTGSPKICRKDFPIDPVLPPQFAGQFLWKFSDA